MEDRKRLILLIVVVVVAVGAAVVMGSKSFSPSEQSITKFERVPPKGAGRFDRD